MRRTGLLRAGAPVLAVATGLSAAVAMAGAAHGAVTHPAETKLISYNGYQTQVPASWPVYDLAKNPTQCVRFDLHAVYLGHPGANQLCVGHPLGRTEALLVEPMDSAAEQQAAATADPESSFGTASAVVGKVLVTVTYGEDKSSVLPFLKSQPQVSESRPIAPTTQIASDPKLEATVPTALSAPTAEPGTSPTSGQSMTAHAAVAPSTVAVGSRGFDACAAPSIGAMHAWWPDPSPYSVANIYVGGRNRACAQYNLTASWVQQASHMQTNQGWTFIPTYVGLQAPCYASPIARMSWNLTTARSQARAEANDAVNAMRNLGFGKGNPVYLDIEGYSGCTSVVLTYISAWTNQLHSLGYFSGVYSSGGSGIRDLVNNYNNHTYTRPDAIWNAHWDGRPTAYNDAYVPNTLYDHKRIKQYLGGHTESHGGVRINIDSDVIDGPVAVLGTRKTLPPSGTGGGGNPPPPQPPSGGGGLNGWSAQSGESLGGYISGAPASASLASNRLDVVTRGQSTHRLYYRYSVNGKWTGWRSIGSRRFTSDPAIVSPAPGRLDVFARGTDGALWHEVHSGGKWHGFHRLGGKLVGGPAVASQRQGEMDVVIRGATNALYSMTYDHGRWGRFYRRGGSVLAGPPTVASWGNGRLDVFVMGRDHALHHTWRTANGWAGRWQSMGGTLTNGPSVLTDGAGKLDVYVRTTGNKLTHRWFDGHRWSSWQNLGGSLASRPNVVTPRSGRIDVFFRGNGRVTRHRWYDAG